jgi:hypothetical protein
MPDSVGIIELPYRIINDSNDLCLTVRVTGYMELDLTFHFVILPTVIQSTDNKENQNSNIALKLQYGTKKTKFRPNSLHTFHKLLILFVT